MGPGKTSRARPVPLPLALGPGTGPRVMPLVMGVLNVTPDSFSDGGRLDSVEAAVRRGLELVREGADLLDIGGESTRPGAPPVPPEEELERVVPVIERLAAACSTPLSVDTRKARVACAALEAGARIVNDVSAGAYDPDMLPLLAEETDCAFVAMHMRGTPETMRDHASYDDVVAEVVGELEERIEACWSAGIERSRILADPGIGFAKTLDHNVEILRRLREFESLGVPLLLGVSRKSFLGELTGVSVPEERLFGTAAAVSACVFGGAAVLRVHDVSAMVQVVRVAAALAPALPGRIEA